MKKEKEIKYVGRTALIKQYGYPESLVDRALHCDYASDYAQKTKGDKGKWVIDLPKFERDYQLGIFGEI